MRKLVISRRESLKLLGGLGAALAVPSGLAFAKTGASLKAESGEGVFFKGWQFRTDLVEANVSRYNSELAGKVQYQTVAGDYPSVMQNYLISGAEVDVLYGNPSQAVRYLEAGWLAPADDLPDFQEVASDMYPNIKDAWSYKDKLMGLSYFVSNRGIIHTNMKRFLDSGLTEADFPKNWPELYDVLYKLRDRGQKEPFLPHWFNEWFGIGWGFAFEVMNRGGAVADPQTHKPMLTDTGPAAETLEAWKRLWKDGFVSEEVLTYNEAAYTGAFRSGRFVMSPQQHYDLKLFNTPGNSPAAGSISFLPYQGQSWGMIDSAMYLMSSRKRPTPATDDVRRFLSWYGYKDQDGAYFVAEKFMKETMLFSAYKGVMEKPETAETIRASLAREGDAERLLEVYKHADYPKGIFNVVWSEEYNAWVKEKLSAFLLNDLEVVKTIHEMNDKMAALNDKYGIH
ncbi:extracellular solute-binding protein [Mesorhizobium sp. M3A.F.Ca.ET.201.01.1.1]|uniref:ABC transporter substrate-binding protein n=1 Tax=Mesorhizobium sp. M3A.F.Ca.ET.201.01.1.1 TaxID=2563946 RepID=UPI001093C32E|nr:extracellular solute-binding protein [Mesorhizobium sp. M3A.F.Ca.ET.201.01.1.1]TGS71733.1 extracellular solute-binding protein [Mesorhizobium sp. M3A.F.Ca.ET.201.01.1.1]